MIQKMILSALFALSSAAVAKCPDFSGMYEKVSGTDFYSEGEYIQPTVMFPSDSFYIKHLSDCMIKLMTRGNTFTMEYSEVQDTYVNKDAVGPFIYTLRIRKISEGVAMNYSMTRSFWQKSAPNYSHAADFRKISK